MKRLPTLFAAALAALLALPAAAQTPRPDEEARPRDLQRLQDDLANLDDELAALPAHDAASDDLRERAEDLREEVIYLKVKMRRARAQNDTGTGVTYDEVSELRRAVAALRQDIGRQATRDLSEMRVPAGTEVVVRLEDALSTRTARREDRFEATVLEPVRLSGAVAVPAGARVRGVVVDAQPAERPSRGGRLELQFDALYIDRDRLDIRGRVVSLAERADQERKRKAGLGAVLGGVVGTILGGRKGALIGVIVGGGGAVVASKGEDIELPEGAVIVMRLDRELVIPRR
jgi:ribosomal protein L29